MDVSRGDMICRPHNRPDEIRDLEAMVCWMAERPLQPDGRYRIKHTTRTVLAKVDAVRYRIDVNSLHRDEQRREPLPERDRPPVPAPVLPALP